MIETRAYNEMSYWVLGRTLGSAKDPIVQGMALMLVMIPVGSWKTMGIAKVVVHLDQSLLPMKVAVELAKHLYLQKEGIGDPYFYLAQLHTTCAELSNLGMHLEPQPLDVQPSCSTLLTKSWT